MSLSKKGIDETTWLTRRAVARKYKYLDRFNSIFSLDVEPVFLRLTPHKGSTSGRSDYGNNFVLLLNKEFNDPPPNEFCEYLLLQDEVETEAEKEFGEAD